jgi:hypothetical protein
MPTVKATAEQISRQLNDQQRGFEYTRWTRVMLIDYISDALVQISVFRPDAFTEVMQIDLQPGVRQQLPEGIFNLASVLDNNDPDNPLAVMRDDMGLVRAFSKKVCHYDFDENGNVVYRLTAYSYDPRVPGFFFVSPPVPLGMSTPPSIGISVVTSPPVLDNTWWLKNLPVDNKYYNAVIAWALSKGYEVDTESESSFRLMQFHRSEFYKMLGVKYSMDSKFNSGWYAGQRGYESNVRGNT